MTQKQKPQTPGGRIRAARLRAKMTQQQLADAMGCGQSRIADWENDRYMEPIMASLRKLAKALGCSVSELANLD